jgi:HSP20 family protein
MLPKKYYLNSIFDELLSLNSAEGMKCDIYEKDGNYHIEADIPGFNKKDINIECKDGYLTITASKEESNEDETKNYIRQERKYGMIKREFYVGDVDTTKIEAEFIDGSLKITIPKPEENDNKTVIDIK